MNATALHQYIRQPKALSASSLEEIKQALAAYPYFQTLKLLYLKNLYLLQHPDFAKELERLAVSVADRRVLYYLLKGKEWAHESEETKEEPAPSAGHAFDLIDAFLASDKSMGEGKGTDEALIPEPLAASDYLHWSEAQPQEPAPESAPREEVKLKHQDLIDSFIEQGGEHHPNLSLEDRAQEPEEPEKEPETEEHVSIQSLDDTYFTETLARIYIKQKRYDKALQIIRNLNLKYPEKNIYFADQIRFLEKLIINTKK